MAAAGVSAAWFIVAARELSVGDFAELALLLSLALLFGVLADLGYPMILSSMTAELPTAAWSAFRHVVFARVLLACGASVLFLGAYRLSSDGSLAVASIFALTLVATSVHSSAAAAMRGLGLVRREAVNEVLSRVFVLALGSALLHIVGGLLVIAVTYAAADMVSACFMSASLRRVAPPADDVDTSRLTVRRALPLATAHLAASAYSRIDVWLLAMLGSDLAVAGYAASYRVFEALALPAAAVGSTSIASMAGSEARVARARLSSLLVAAAVLSVPAALAVALFARTVLELMFGHPYGEETAVLRVLLLALPASLLIGAIGPWVTLRRPRAVAGGMIAALVLNVLLNLLLIPPVGTVGAALATAVAQTALAVVFVRAALTASRS